MLRNILRQEVLMRVSHDDACNDAEERGQASLLQVLVLGLFEEVTKGDGEHD